MTKSSPLPPGQFQPIIGTNHPWVKETQGFTNKNHLIMKKDIMCFFLLISMLGYKDRFEQMYSLIGNGFSGEGCGTWASYFSDYFFQTN